MSTVSSNRDILSINTFAHELGHALGIDSGLVDTDHDNMCTMAYGRDKERIYNNWINVITINLFVLLVKIVC